MQDEHWNKVLKLYCATVELEKVLWAVGTCVWFTKTILLQWPSVQIT